MNKISNFPVSAAFINILIFLSVRLSKEAARFFVLNPLITSKMIRYLFSWMSFNFTFCCFEKIYVILFPSNIMILV